MLGPPFLNFHDRSLAADSCSKENPAAVAGAHEYGSGQAHSADAWSETQTSAPKIKGKHTNHQGRNRDKGGTYRLEAYFNQSQYTNLTRILILKTQTMKKDMTFMRCWKFELTGCD